MTDNEIITALKCCLNVDSKCADCHFLFERHFCKNALLKQTLDLINRQKIEIESLKIANEKMYVANKEQEAEIERLETNNLSTQKTLSKMSLGVEQAKAEAIKDFAERLKKRLDRKYKIYGREYVLRHLRELVKEMIGGEAK